MSIWDTYPDLTPANFRTLVAVTAQVLLDSDTGAAEFPPDLLQQSTAENAREIVPLLMQTDQTVTRQNVQEMLEDEELAARACRTVLDQVRTYPQLAERIAQEYEARAQKLTGVEVVLLAGAVVILAMRIKRWGPVEFEPANEVVKTFVAGLAKGIGIGQP